MMHELTNLECSVFFAKCGKNPSGKIPSSVITNVITSLLSVCMSQRDVPRKGETELYVTGRPLGTPDLPFVIYSCKF
jgi:hypothetical protein